MYIPKLFENKNLDEVKNFIQKNSFAILTSQVNNKPWATHIPLELEVNKDGKAVLQGHISKANEQWKNFNSEETFMAIFSGPHAYISSSWYDHENVPTWNYIAVHIYGKIKILEGDDLWEMIKKLVDKYEKNSENPVSLNKMNKENTLLEMKGLVGFEMQMEEIQAAYKLSQNRDSKNHQNIVTELEKNSDPITLELAKEMKKKKP